MNLSEADMLLAAKIIGLVVAIGAIALGTRKFITHCVESALKQQDVIDRIALLVKPDLVFDENTSVLADRGASALLKDGGIHITRGTDSTNETTNGVPITIRIAFKKHFATAPLLTPIGPDVIFVTSTRGSEFEWVYTLHYTLRSGYGDLAVVRTYRLEVI